MPYWCARCIARCCERTMYRILAANSSAKERRNQAQRRRYVRPQLCATGPNQLWSWDISKLALADGGYVNLYTIEDVFSRYVVGWMVAPSESATLACQLVETSAHRQQLRPGQLTLHADRGSVMTSELLTRLLRRLEITQTHSRAARNTVLAAAFDRHPERFVHGLPTAPALPDAVWINPPSPEPQPLGQDQKEPLQ